MTRASTLLDDLQSRLQRMVNTRAFRFHGATREAADDDLQRPRASKGLPEAVVAHTEAAMAIAFRR